MKVKRLIDCTFDEMQELNAIQLKESILRSEGRVICGQTNTLCLPHITGATNMEMVAAMGSDMIMVNTYHLKDNSYNVGLCGLTFERIKELTRNLVGIYLECPHNIDDNNLSESRKEYFAGRIATMENIEKALDIGANFIVLGGNPGMGTTLDVVIEATKKVKEIVGNRCLIMAGKWEDGVDEKVLGDPLADYDTKDIIKQLVEAGADVITFPAPGSRHGITVEIIRELVEYTHRLDAVALCFLDSSVEGADEDSIRLISLWMKQTGADIHTIGDAGYPGMPIPENIYTMSMAIRGRRFTFQRIAGRNREKKDYYNHFGI